MRESAGLQLLALVVYIVAVAAVRGSTFEYERQRVALVGECPSNSQIVMGWCTIDGKIVPQLTRSVTEVEAQVRMAIYEQKVQNGEHGLQLVGGTMIAIAIAAMFFD